MKPKKREACVMKKTMELSVLCDVKACTIIVDADGSVETWPKNPSDLNSILDQYRKRNSRKKQSDNVVVAAEDNPQDVLSKLNSKIEAVEKRIEFLKRKSITDGCGKEKNSLKKREFHWDGEIELSDNCFAAANNVEEPCPEGYFWDFETGYFL